MFSKSEMKTYFIRVNCHALRNSFKHDFHETTYFKPTFCIHCTGLVSTIATHCLCTNPIHQSGEYHCNTLHQMHCTNTLHCTTQCSTNTGFGYNEQISAQKSSTTMLKTVTSCIFSSLKEEPSAHCTTQTATCCTNILHKT